jgi:hypothetical protein
VGYADGCCGAGGNGDEAMGGESKSLGITGIDIVAIRAIKKN